MSTWSSEIMTGHGGWPNNVFLTSDCKPFFAGSYFPPKDDPAVGTGFPTILAALHGLWTEHRNDKVVPTAEKVFQGWSWTRALHSDDAARAAFIREIALMVKGRRLSAAV
jgi:uncharacterized protein YyaL (SSP411 family)